MPKIAVNPPRLARPSGFSHGIEARGRLLFLAGQTAQDTHGRIVAPGDLVGQFRQALANVGTVVAARGGSLRDLVKITFYVRDKADYRAKARAIGEVYREMLGGHYPATTLVEVSALWDDEALVEIDGTAVLESPAPPTGPAQGAHRKKAARSTTTPPAARRTRARRSP
jgi:enamine deaminase RidA (YjgF/YER057c/UK114 family)